MSQPCLFFAGGGTGGHVFPLIAVANSIRQLAPEVRCIFVGSERGLESKLVPEAGYELEVLPAKPIRGGGVMGALSGVANLGALVPRAGKLIRQYRPAAVFSLGGYAAGALSLAAKTSGVPLALMEPNSVVGWANRLIAPMVSRAYLGFGEAASVFPKRAVRLSGVALRGTFLPREYSLEEPLRVLVLGGSQGAKSLNETVPEALARCTNTIEVVHQTGAGKEAAVIEAYERLGAGKRARVIPFIDDMAGALARAHLIIGRAGAGAIAEICAVGRPSVLVPYPFAAGDHQRKNAQAIANAGAGLCVEPDELNADQLAIYLDNLFSNPGRLIEMADIAQSLGKPFAAETVARDLLLLSQLRSAESLPAIKEN